MFIQIVTHAERCNTLLMKSVPMCQVNAQLCDRVQLLLYHGHGQLCSLVDACVAAVPVIGCRMLLLAYSS